MEENTIIEEGIDTVFDEVGKSVEDTLTELPTIVEETGNGDIQVLPVAIGVAIGGALVLGVKKLYKIIKAKKESRYLTPEQKTDIVEEEDPEIDEVEEK